MSKIKFTISGLIFLTLVALFFSGIQAHADDPLGQCSYPNGQIISDTYDQCMAETAGGGSWVADPITTPATTTPASNSSSSSSSSSDRLVPCNNTPKIDSSGLAVTSADGTVTYDSKCDFNALMALVNNVIHFILFDMAIPIAAIMFAYAGILMISAGEEAAGARTKAKGIFLNAVIGLAVAAAGWLIVSTILAILGFDGSWIGLVVKL